MSRRPFPTRTALATAVLLAGAACDEPFDPIGDVDRGVSIFGVLDAAADTQWIRVTPVRPSVLTDPDPPDVEVTLEHLGTGEISVMNDSLFAYPATHLDPGTFLYARNFWTDVLVEPGATYRLTATAADGTNSTVLVPVPDEADSVVVGVPLSGSGLTGYLRTYGVEYLATVHVFPGCRGDDFAYQGGGPDVTADGLERIGLSLRLACEGGDTIRARGARLVYSGAPWPYDPRWNEVTAFLPHVASNVEDGLGFVGGVLTRTIQFDTCRFVTSGSSEYCEVLYTGEDEGPGGLP